jgi:UDP:flavonoid glycosyltransferase YjiC (YdhE family)
MHFVLVTLGSHGDVHPFVGLGEALARRGWRVTIACNEYFAALVRRIGLECVEHSRTAEYEAKISAPALWDPKRGFHFIVHEMLIPAIAPIYELVRRHHVPGQTVFIAPTTAIGARIAQEKLGAPLVSVHLAPLGLRSTHAIAQPPGIPNITWLPRWAHRTLFRFLDWAILDPALAPAVNGFRAELGLSPVSRVFDQWWHSPQLVLGMFPEWFAPPQPDWPEQTRLVGFPLYDERGLEPLDPKLEAFLADGEPPVVFTPGSAMKQGQTFFREALEACCLLRRRGLFLTRFPEQLPATLPADVLHVHYAPFSQVLPRAVAVVHHGGIGTTAQGLAAGIPHLVMPLAHDQPDHALRLRKLGVGASLPPSVFRAARVAEVLGQLLGSVEVRRRCHDLARRFHGQDALDMACRLIESLSVDATAAS